MDEDIDQIETDVLVLGGGMAGHRAALAAHKQGAAVTIAYPARGASPYVIGCNVPLDPDAGDTPAIYAEDMVRGGYGLNDRRLVSLVAEEATSGFRELCELGVSFARDGDRVQLRHLSGNRVARSVYVAEGTGRAIIDALARQVQRDGIRTLSGWKALTLLRHGATVTGALLWHPQKQNLTAVHARAVVLAAGGIGRLFDDSTYPADVSAGAYGLALQAGARLIDMEFVQFEPVVTVHPVGCAGMEMPTAMLGAGAHLLNAQGDRFMFRYNPEHGERHIEKARMSLCIQTEIDAGRGFPDGTVLFDTRPVPPAQLESYVSHCRRLRAAGLDPREQGPRVRPAAHSQMGGIFIDETGSCGVPGLYAGGEAVGGLHGASRIAGNGCSDTIVLGAVAGRGAAAGLLPAERSSRALALRGAIEQLRALSGQRGDIDPVEAKAAVCRSVSSAAAIWRREATLAAGLTALRGLARDIEGPLAIPDLTAAVRAIEARDMVQTAQTIVEAALLRTESRGAHQRTDHPEQNDVVWLRHIGFRAGTHLVPEVEYIPLH